MTRKDYLKAAALVRTMAQNVIAEFVRPIAIAERGMSTERAEGLAVWQAREAFVLFFAADNARFDADRFREACHPVNGSEFGAKPSSKRAVFARLDQLQKKSA